MRSPSNWAPAEIEFHKLDALPKKPHDKKTIQQAMKVLHRMVHKQAEKYGGNDSKLLPAGIAEGAPTFKTFIRICSALEG